MLHYYKLFDIIKIDYNTQRVFFNIIDNEMINILGINTSDFKTVFSIENNCSYTVAPLKDMPKCSVCNKDKLAQYVETLDKDDNSFYTTYLCKACFDYTRGLLTEEEMLEL